MPTQPACVSKTKNHSKIHRWQVRSSFVGAEMCPDKKRPAENTCRIVKGLDAVWAHFCPSKPCLPLSIDGSVKGNRQGSLSRSITRRSDQNRKIKYCFLFCDFASACQKSPNGLFDKLKKSPVAERQAIFFAYFTKSSCFRKRFRLYCPYSHRRAALHFMPPSGKR